MVTLTDSIDIALPEYEQGIADVVIDRFTLLGKVKYSLGIPFEKMVEGIDYERTIVPYTPPYMAELNHNQMIREKAKEWYKKHGKGPQHKGEI